jgi:hypothetical protein
MRFLVPGLLMLATSLAAAPTPAPVDGSAAPVFLAERYYSAPQSQTVDPPVRVGDILRFRWIGEQKPPTSAVEITPGEEGKSLPELGWEVYSHPKDDPTSAFSVIPIRPGDVELPALAVRDAEKRVLGVTRPIKLTVAAAASAEELSKKPPEFLPPLAMQLPWIWIAVLVVLGLALAGVVAAVLWRASRKSRKRPALSPASPPRTRLPEDEEALRMLENLEKQRLWLEQRFKPHYFGVSEAMKKYIERRFGFDAAESTTREMLAGLSTRGIDRERLVGLSSLFERLDRVKFTDFVPEEPECSWILEEARAWIRATRQAAPRTGGADAV